VLRACLLAGLLLPGWAVAAVMPRLGDYLDTAYIRALQKTRSPLAAAQEDSRAHIAQMVSVQAQGSARRFAASYDWHSGSLLFVLQRDGTIHREMAWGHDPATALRVTGAEGFCLTPLRGTEHCYRFVRHVDRFIAATVLAGRYVDRQGAPYRFSAGGHAYFPGYDFPYSLMLEQVDDKYDFFAVGTEGRFIAFSRNGTLVTLYPVNAGRGAGFGTPDFTHKLAVLRELPDASSAVGK
jgi:hypothetical protein